MPRVRLGKAVEGGKEHIIVSDKEGSNLANAACSVGPVSPPFESYESYNELELDTICTQCKQVLNIDDREAKPTAD